MIDREFDITFDGVSCFECVPDIKILEIEIDAAEIETSAQARAVRSGADFISNRYATRQIRISFELPFSDYAQQAAYRSLRKWATSAEPRPLRLPQYPGDEIHAILTSAGSYNEKEWYLPVELVFTAYDPCFVSVAWKQATAGTLFSVSGNDIALARVVCNLKASTQNPEFDFDTGEKIKLIGTLHGEIVVDLERMSVTNNGSSAMGKLDITSRFPDLTPGRHSFTGPDDSIIQWKERWI